MKPDELVVVALVVVYLICLLVGCCAIEPRSKVKFDRQNSVAPGATPSAEAAVMPADRLGPEKVSVGSMPVGAEGWVPFCLMDISREGQCFIAPFVELGEESSLGNTIRVRREADGFHVYIGNEQRPWERSKYSAEELRRMDFIPVVKLHS
ncbi:MAG: hypothetical protein ABH822_00990 [Patescibacteria group bacterium]